MEQITTVQTQAPQQQHSLRKMLGMGQGQPAGDAFAMIFQQMMGDGENVDGDIVEMLAQLFGTLQKDSEEEGTLLASEMLAMMPGLAPQDLFALTQSDPAMMTGAVNALAASLSTPQGRAQLPNILAQIEKGGSEELQELLDQADLSQADKEFIQVLENAWKEEPQPAIPVTTLDQSAIRAAKELLAKNRKDQNTETIDVESLQADVNSRRFLTGDTVSQKQQLPVPDAQEIAKQLKTGILENLARGKNEFLVRLKPEGIGEIMVRFTENKDKITLSIFTHDTQTARLISGEVAALQNALKPLNAEVQEITTVAGNEQAAQYSQQNQMTDQGRQFFGHQTSQEGRSSRRGGVSAIQEEDSFDETVEVTLGDEALDTYI